MTNDYGTGQPPHEEESQPEQNPEGGAWTADHPPAEAPTDDFSDPPAEEGAVTVSQETEAESEDASHGAPGRSRSLTWPLVAGVAGLLFLAAVVYWQFGRSAQPPVPPMVMMASQNAPPKNPAPMPAIPGSSSSAGSTANTSAELEALKPSPETSYTDSAPTAPKTAMATAPEMPQAPTVSGSPGGIAMPVKTPAPPSPMPVKEPAVAAAIPAAMPAGAAADARIDALTARVDSLEKSLNQATKQLNQVANMMAANQTTPTVENRLNKIEQNMLELQHGQAAKMAAAPVVSMPSPAASAAMPMMEPAPVVGPSPIAPKIAEKSSASSPAHKTAAAKTKTAAKKKPAPKTPPAPHWVLRAATPNEAWVSASATSSDLRHIQVGDILPGIGRIQAIRQTESGWVVQGANGTVH